ncbi:MAG: VOC family protein [Acidimicrobiia bacterium]
MSGFEALVTFLPVSDLEVADRFYGGALRLVLERDQGVCRIYRVSDSALLGICTHIDPTPSRGVITTLVTPDVDGWHRRLAAAGVEMDGPPRQNARFGIYHFYVDDPDGNRLEVQRFEGEA